MDSISSPLTCVCHGEGSDSRLVACDNCRTFYHFDCIHLTPSRAEELCVYICDSCSTQTGKRAIYDWENIDPSVMLLPEPQPKTKREDKSRQNRPRRRVNSQPDDLIDTPSASEHEAADSPPLASSSSNFSGSDTDNASRSLKRRRNVRRTRRAVSTSSSSDDEPEKRERRLTAKARANLSSKPARKVRRKEPPAPATAADDPARKYCLSQLQTVLSSIFEEHHSPSGPPASELTNSYATDLENELFKTYAEPDKHGLQSVGLKYKAQFRMLTFNLEKNDRVILRQRIGSDSLSPAELSVMSNTDLASEQQKKEMQTAQEESLHHSILAARGADRPLRKITHKGEEMIEDINEMGDELARMSERQSIHIPRNILRHSGDDVSSPTVPSMNSPTTTITPVNLNLDDGVANLPSSPKSPLTMTASAAKLESSSPTAELSGGGNINPSKSFETPSSSSSLPVTQTRRASTSTSTAPSRPTFDLGSISWFGGSAGEDNPTSVLDSSSAQRSFADEPMGMDPIAESADNGGMLGGADLDFNMDGVLDDHDFSMFLDADLAGPSTVGSMAEGPIEAPPPPPQKREAVWTGDIIMPQPGAPDDVHHLSAYYVAGRVPVADAQSHSNVWGNLFRKTQYQIEGRVPIDAGNKYLLNSRLNSGRQLVAVVLEPPEGIGRTMLLKLIDGLTSKKRHAVVMPWGSPPSADAIGKELYLVPLAPSDPVPEYLQMLDDLQMPNRSGPILLGFFILQKKKLAGLSQSNPAAAPPAPPALLSSLPSFTPPPPLTAPPASTEPILPPNFDLSSLTPEFINGLLQSNPGLRALVPPTLSAPSPVQQPTPAFSPSPALPSSTYPVSIAYPPYPNIPIPPSTFMPSSYGTPPAPPALSHFNEQYGAPPAAYPPPPGRYDYGRFDEPPPRGRGSYDEPHRGRGPSRGGYSPSRGGRSPPYRGHSYDDSRGGGGGRGGGGAGRRRGDRGGGGHGPARGDDYKPVDSGWGGRGRGRGR